VAEQPESRALCALQQPEQVNSDAVVFLEAALEPGFLQCSGAVLTPTLLLTAQSCVTRPPQLGDLHSPGAAGNVPVGTIDYTQVCSPDVAWLPREDGSFAARFGQPIAPEALTARWQRGERIQAQQVISSGAASRCADGLALIQLRRELEVQPLPLRLDEHSYEGEIVQLSAYCTPPGVPRWRELASTVEAVSYEIAGVGMPPRALRVSHQVSALELGGAVLSAETGQLLGVLASGERGSCSESDPLGTSIALRVAPFRRWLLDSAEALGETLRVLPGGQWSGEPPACPGEP
jgi:hypothetical protein